MEQLPLRSLILVIDDDDMVRLMLQSILNREGFDVISAINGEQGLKIVKSDRPDLILLDVMMPDISGFECLEIIRALPGSDLLPIVMLTGADDLSSVNRSFELGATDFIAKPLNWPTLPHRLRYLLRASFALKKLARSEAELRKAQRIARLGSWDWQVTDDQMQWSEEVFNILGIDHQSFKGRRLDLLNTIAPSEATKLDQAMERCLKNQHSFLLELPIQHHAASNRVIHIQGEPIIEDGAVKRVHGTIQDITERRHIEEHVRFLSYYDALTGLPNRTLFRDILSQAINYCNRYPSKLSTLFISIDRFKRINQTLGPKIGDQVLKMFADRLVTEVRNCDYVSVNADYDFANLSVSRLSGNEFTVLLNRIQDGRDSIKVANRIFEVMQQAFQVEGTELFLNINVGITLYPGDGDDEDSLIKNGEFAMNYANQQGQNTYQFFNQSLNAEAFQKLEMENNLRRAIERDELQLYYQPKIDMRRHTVIGCEALIRWNHPKLGLVAPTQFIPIAEDSGLIIRISNWVLETACKQLRSWQRQGLCRNLVVAVNISAHQFHQPDFSDFVSATLSTTGLPARHLKLELTESTLLDHFDQALITLQRLKTLGIEISIDDFGTGYSSLAYLKKLPISELKVDRCFIRDIPDNEDDTAITIAILALAKALSMDVVAEGVENQDQVDFLLKNGCDTAQGFFYSKPLPYEEFQTFLQEFTLEADLVDS